MIIALIALFVLALYFSTIRIKNKIIRTTFMALSFVGLIGTLGFMLANELNHYGMKEVEEVATQEIKTIGDEKQPYGLIIKNPLGSSSNEDETAYVYKDKDGQQQNLTPDLKKPDEQIDVNVIKNTSDTAKLITKTKKWVYNDDLARIAFGLAGNENQTASTTYDFSIPENNWYVLSADQVKKLQNMPKPSPAEQVQMQTLAQSNPEEYKKLVNNRIKSTLGL